MKYYKIKINLVFKNKNSKYIELIAKTFKILMKKILINRLIRIIEKIMDQNK